MKARPRIFGFLVFLWAMLSSAMAQAHQAGLSRGTYRLDGAMFTAEIIFARTDALRLARDLDADGDGTITSGEVQNARNALGKSLTAKLVVRTDKEDCLGNVDDAFLVEEDGLSIRMVYLCPVPPPSVHVRFDLLDLMTYGHRHLARAESGAIIVEKVLFGAEREWELSRAAATLVPEKPVTSPRFGGFFLMGIEHILLGYDHLVFLMGIVLAGFAGGDSKRPSAHPPLRWKPLLLVITAFTLAHSITLGLSVLGVWAPSPRIVEPLIALSVAYVGVENQFVENADTRWRITFPFGLIHGFGFAGALGEIQVPKADVPHALIGFNLGVEAGQLAALAVVLPLLHIARKRTWLDKRRIQWASWVICGLGCVWFVLRIMSPG